MVTKPKVKPRVDMGKPKAQSGGKGQVKRTKSQRGQSTKPKAGLSAGQTETALLESESQFRILFDNLPVGIGVADLAGNLLVYNNAMLKPGDYSREDITQIGNVAALYYDPQQRRDALALLQKQGFLKEFPVRFKRKDGTPYDVLLSLTPITFRGKPCIQAMVEDISERKRTEEQLRRQVEELHLQSAALDAAANSIVIANREGIIEWVNPAYILLTGYTMDEVIGKNPRFLKSGFHDLAFYKNMWNTILSGKVWHSEVVNKRKDGSFYTVDETLTPLLDRNGQVTHFIGINQEITERKRAEAQIKNQLERLNALHSIDKAISSSFDLRTTLQVLLNEVIAQLKVDAASVLLFNNVTMTLDYTASRGFHSNAIQHTKLRFGEGHAGRVIENRQTIYIPDLNKAEGKLAKSLSLAKENFTAYIGAPLIVKGQILGVLEIFQRAPIDSDPEWFSFLETLAGQAAIAIDNIQLFENLQRTNFELMLSYDATIEGWSRAMDLRDHETEGHTQRVTDLTLKLARQMGISEADILHIRRGALLHDIGKMGIPDGILHKADQLTEQEWEIMHMHTIYAYEMLTPIPYLKPALDIPRYHHEKWDGTGHPHGLKGEEIPLPARIFAIVDVWDALTTDRPYRKAWSREKAVEFIKTESGKHFDPNVAKAFLALTSDA